MTRDLLVLGGTVVTPHGRFEGDVAVRDGRIAAFGRDLGADAATPVLDARGLVVLPGIIDPHSHLWEAGFVSGPDFTDSTASAAAGGITTIIEMPLTVPEVLDETVLKEKAALGERTSHVDFALYGGVSPDRLDDLDGMWAGRGPRPSRSHLRHRLRDEGRHRRRRLGRRDVAHRPPRRPRLLPRRERRAPRRQPPPAGLRRSAATTPPSATGTARRPSSRRSNRILFYAGRLGTRVPHRPRHLAEGVRLVERARGEGVRATAETCPHYLYLTERRHRRPRRLGHLRAADARAGGDGRHARPPR